MMPEKNLGFTGWLNACAIAISAGSVSKYYDMVRAIFIFLKVKAIALILRSNELDNILLFTHPFCKPF